MADSRNPRPRLQQHGWSAYTQKNSHHHSHGLPTFARELPPPDPSQFVPLSREPVLLHETPSPTGPSFAAALKVEKKEKPSSFLHGLSHSYGEDEPSQPQALMVSRLHACHRWADESLIADLLQALDMDEDSTFACLVSMSNENTQRGSASNDTECSSSSQDDGDGGHGQSDGASAGKEPVLFQGIPSATGPSFTGDLKVEKPSPFVHGLCHSDAEAEPSQPLALMVSRLKACHSWADESLIIDLLQALDLDEDSTFACLVFMSKENTQRVSASNDTCSSSSQDDGDGGHGGQSDGASADKEPVLFQETPSATGPSFTGALKVEKKKKPSPFVRGLCHSDGEAEPLQPQALMVSRLKACHSWADESLITDLLQALDLDEDSTFACLVFMSKENMQRVSASNDTECSSSSPDDGDGGHGHSDGAYADKEPVLFQETPSLTGPSFTGALKMEKKKKPSPFVHGLCHSDGEAEPSQPQALMVSRLKACHSWADESLIADLLQALDLDEDSTFACLVSMSNENMQRVSASNDTECSCSSQDDGYGGHGQSDGAYADKEPVLFQETPSATGRSYTGALMVDKKKKPSPFVHGLCHSDGEAEPSQTQALTVSRLKACHSWADENLIADLLQALDLNEDITFAYLVSMSNENTQKASAWNHTEYSSSSQCDVNGGHGQSDKEDWRGPNTKRRFPFSGESVPAEPEWEEDDIYHVSRRDALRMSRASVKHSRGAYKAFTDGDYSRAKMLSKKAHNERMEAERLHAEAAKQIFEAHNGDAERDVWRLDLHGLHVREAVAVLQQRLLEIETALPNTRCTQDASTSVIGENSSSVSQQSMQKLRLLQGTAACGLPFRQELKVITGVGNHSRGGGSLPMAIRSFLIQNRYKFEESRPGMVVVNPKFQLLKDK